MSGTTTIDQSTTLATVLLGANYLVEQNGGTPPNDPVVLNLGVNVIAASTFTVQDGAMVQIDSPLNVGVDDKFIIGQNGTLDIGGGISVAALNDIEFNGGVAGGELILESGTTISLLSPITGFAGGDSIDFSGTAPPASPASYTANFDSGTGDTNVTITLAGGGTNAVALQGDYETTPLQLSTAASGGVLLADMACFAPGTRILTTRGEIAVEDLATGDIAVLADGATSPITFIGHRLLNLRRHPNPQKISPVRIAAGALADGIPARSLTLSPDHAMLIDGVLVQTKDLIDGIAVIQDMTASAIRYYHVELETHGILLAEGAAAESFLDTGHRGIFDNAAGPLLLHPDLMQLRREAESVAPLCHDGEKLKAIRARLHARKLALGFGVVESTGATLDAGGKTLRPTGSDPAIISFDLPEGVAHAVLKTEIFVPAMFDPASDDRRRLGLALAEITVDGQLVALGDILDPGDLHDRGAGDPICWTRGELHLRLPALAQQITFHVAGRPKAWRQVA